MDDEGWLSHEIAADRCFLCGVTLTPELKTKEHVFPAWLLDDFELRRQEMTLLNGTHIYYEKLVIPCCVRCNTGPLSRLEKQISVAFREGPEAVRNLDPEILFLWLSKFYLGLLVREMTLVHNGESGKPEYIASPQLVKLYSIHQLLLTRLNGKVDWDTFPSSLFIFECSEDGDRKRNFDYFDSTYQPYVSVRIGKTYVAAFLQDFGAVKSLGIHSWNILNKAAAVKLNNAQSIELDCFFLGILSSHKVAKLLVNKHGEKSIIHVLPRGGLSGQPSFSPWPSEDECFEVMQDMFQQRLQITLEKPKNGLPTFFP
jgi:hypothetical protein